MIQLFVLVKLKIQLLLLGHVLVILFIYVLVSIAFPVLFLTLLLPLFFRLVFGKLSLNSHVQTIVLFHPEVFS